MYPTPDSSQLPGRVNTQSSSGFIVWACEVLRWGIAKNSAKTRQKLAKILQVLLIDDRFHNADFKAMHDVQF